MRCIDLFAGIGGFPLAARWMGWETVAWCEWNEFCQKVLRYHFPEAEGFGDITKTDFKKYANTIDVLTGGFPCQPYSQAGKRKGKADDRHLWPEMLRAIREVQPRWVVGENVSGLLNWNRGMVLDEIKADLEAAGFEVIPPLVLPACGKDAPHRRDRVWIVAHSNRDGQYGGNSEHEVNTSEGREYALNDVEQVFDAANSNGIGLQGEQNNGNSNGIRQERNEQFGFSISSAWQNFPTQPPICGGNDGIPNRVDRIKALGNSVVPQVVYQIFKTIEQYEKSKS